MAQQYGNNRFSNYMDWVKMGSKPGFDPEYMQAVSGGTPQEWADFRDSLMAVDPEKARRMGAEQLAQFEQDDKIAQDWRANGTNIPWEEFKAAWLAKQRRSGGRGPGTSASPPSDGGASVMDSLAEAVSAALATYQANPSAGNRTALYDAIIAHETAKGSSAADAAATADEYIASHTPASGDVADLPSAPVATIGEYMKTLEDRGEFRQPFDTFLSQRTPNTLPGSIQERLSQRYAPLTSAYQVLQGLGENVAGTFTDFLKDSFGNIPRFTRDQYAQLASGIADPLATTGGVGDTRQYGALEDLARNPAQQGGVMQSLYGQALPSYLRGGASRLIQRDFDKFFGGGDNDNLNFVQYLFDKGRFGR